MTMDTQSSNTVEAAASNESASPTVYDGIAAFADALGHHLGYSAWHTVSQQQIDQFAEATGDHQWIHVDVEKAAKGPYGRTIAHGRRIAVLVSESDRLPWTLSGRLTHLEPVGRVDLRAKPSTGHRRPYRTLRGMMLMQTALLSHNA